MDYIKLSNTDILVSKVCLGTMTFGDQNTEAEAHEQLDYALSQGINFIDTADVYSRGISEEIVGRWMKSKK